MGNQRIDIYQKIIKEGRFHSPVAALIGVRFVLVERGKAIFHLDAQEHHINSIGTVQGGILTVIADSAMGIAYGSLLEEEQGFCAIDININFLHPVFKGYLTAIGTVGHSGKRSGFAECEIFLHKNQERVDTPKLVAKATSNLILL